MNATQLRCDRRGQANMGGIQSSESTRAIWTAGFMHLLYGIGPFSCVGSDDRGRAHGPRH